MNQAKLRSVFAASALLASHALVAQTTPKTVTSNDSATQQSQDDTIELSPFLVEATHDEGYQAVNTLAGTRVRTDLRDVASSISVVTSKFMQDTGARNAQDLLVYTTNTEIGGIGGNFGGLGSANGLSENSALLHPSQNTRVRGLDAADNTRDYFLSDIPWDSYNIDRIDLQRGPNSILFGVGSPAGIVNSQTVIADLHKNSGKIENRIDQFGSIRDSVDENIVLLKNVLSLRVDALDDDTKYREKPAFDRDRRVFAALRFDPKLFGDSSHTSIRANFESGTINANRPRDLAPMDQITPFFAQSSLNPKDSTEPTPYKLSIDPWVYQSTIITGSTANNTTLGLYGAPANWDPWLVAAMARLGSADPVFWYNSNSSTPFRIQQSNIDSNWALAKDGTIDKTIDGLPFAHQVAIQGYNTYTKNAELRAAALGLADPYPGAQKNYYKDKSLTDPSIFDFYNKLIDGPNKMEKEGWHSWDLNVSQTFFDNRLGFEVVWDKQTYYARQETNLSDTPFISVDINKNLTVVPDIAAYSGLANGTGTSTGAVANPDYGRAYIGSSGHYGNHSEQNSRNDYRVTTFGELRASDFLGKNWLSDLLGRHDLNVLVSRDERKEDDRDYLRYATDLNWATNSNETTSITQGFRNVDWITYLSGDLSGQSSAKNSNISNITATQSPTGTQTVQYFNSHWKPSTNPSDATYVDPAAVWTSAYYGGASTQSENPANYVGWTTTPVSFLNADGGDRDQLYYDGTKVKNVINTQGFTWQGYLWDDTIVPTFGYRKDKVRTYSAVAAADPTTGVADEDYGYSNVVSSESSGISHSYGLVFHTPKFIKKHLPWGTDISLTYDQSSNFRAENRVDFQGNPVPNAQGKTREFGVVVSTLDERLTFKITKYKTTVYNADLSGDPSSSTLGANTYWLWASQAWGIASALTDELGLQNKAPGASWYWDWASNDLGYNSSGQQVVSAGTFPRPAAAATIDAHEQAAADAWIANMPSQSFFDAYGLPINVAKIKAGDYADGIGGGWQPGSIGSIQPAGAGKINGLSPVGTIDNVSKGYEFELTAKPLKNWDITFNASKTTASRTDLSATLSAFIESEHQILSGPAGDLRTWWAGDSGTFRVNFDGNIYSAYLFQLEQNGQSAPEVHPWAFNTVTNYTFDHGWSKGFNVGGGFRWQDRSILGYGLIAAPTETDPNNVKLNVNDPLYGPRQSHFDLWFGYEHKLTHKITWRIQANLRNVGEKVHLEAISVEPDGSPAAMRIVEGQTWTLTNTFTF